MPRAQLEAMVRAGDPIMDALPTAGGIAVADPEKTRLIERGFAGVVEAFRCETCDKPGPADLRFTRNHPICECGQLCDGQILWYLPWDSYMPAPALLAETMEELTLLLSGGARTGLELIHWALAENFSVCSALGVAEELGFRASSSRYELPVGHPLRRDDAGSR